MHTPKTKFVLFITTCFLLFGIGSASAECQPGQVHEADLAYSEAVKFLQARQYDEAIPRLQSVLDICDEHLQTLMALARAYKGAKQYEAAETAFQVLITARGDDVSGADYGNLGNVQAKLKKWPEARSSLVKAQILRPDDCAILFNLGVAYYAEQNFRKAVETLEEGVDKCPDIREQLLPQLVKACDKAAGRERTMGNIEKADYYAEKNRLYAGQAGGSTAYDQVRKLMREKNYSAAVGVLSQMLEQDADRKSALLSMARCKVALGQTAESIPFYERYIVHVPDDHKTTGELIRSYAEMGNVSKAISLASSSEGHFRSMGRKYLAPIYYAWGMALEKSGDFRASKAMFEKVPGCGDAEWTPHAYQQIERQDGLIRQEEHRKSQDN